MRPWARLSFITRGGGARRAPPDVRRCVRSFSAAAAASTPAVTPSLASLHARFLAAYGGQAPVTPIEAWMQSFYRRPHAELLPAVFLEALRTPGAFVGPHALPAAVFLSLVLRRICTTRADVDAVLAMFFDAVAAHAAASSPSSPPLPRAAVLARGSGEHLDTLLRAFALADAPHFDEVVAAASAEWVASLDASPWPPPGAASATGGALPTLEDMRALAASLLPPPGARNRTSFLRWPIPTLNLSAFEAHLRSEPFALYGATRHLFARTHAMHALAQRGTRNSEPNAATTARHTFVVLSPRLAQDVTVSMVEAMWAHFYATGDARAVSRVVDVGVAYGEFLDEFGDAPVTAFNGLDDDMSPPPEAIADDPYACMRFNASRFALWSLLWHASRHTAVGDAFASSYASLNDKAALLDPMDTGEALTAFGRSRLELMRVLLPSMTECAASAWSGGIGSGTWPPAYALLHEGVGGGEGALLGAPQRHLLPAAAGHNSAPAHESIDLGAALCAGATATITPDAASRDRRRPRVPTRVTRFHTPQ